MKVLLIVTGFPDVNGHGASAFNHVYVNELQARGIDVTIVHLRSLNPKRWLLSEKKINPAYYTISAFMPRLMSIHPLFLHRLFEWSFRRMGIDYDVVHAVGGGAAMAASVAAKVKRVPFILQFIGSDINVSLDYFLMQNTFVGAINGSEWLCFNSNALLQVFNSKYDLSKYPTKVLRRGIRLSEFSYNFDINDEIRLLFLGGAPNGNSKGAYTLLEAIEKLNNEKLNKKVCFLLGGPNSRILRNTISISNEKVRCVVLGELAREEVICELQKSHIVLIPSLHEGIPNVLFEAMATGNMVIASDVGGISEVLKNGVNGVLVEPARSDLLAEKIVESINHDEIIQDCAYQGRKIIEMYDYNRFIEDYITMYHDLTINHKDKPQR